VTHIEGKMGSHWELLSRATAGDSAAHFYRRSIFKKDARWHMQDMKGS
jgi:hypothetical protein